MIKKFTAYAVIFGMLVLPMAGCSTKSNVQSWSENQAKGQMYSETNRTKSIKYATQALQNILGIFEKQALENGIERIKENSPVAEVVGDSTIKDNAMFRHTTYNSAGKVNGLYELGDVTAGYVKVNNKMIDYLIQKDINDLELELGRTRERVVVAFQPIFEDICTRMETNGTPPSSWIDVARDFVKHVPIMASMGAMYGLGVAGIDAAGSTITATLNDNAKLNSKSTIDDNSASSMVEMAEPEVEAEIVEEL